MCTIAILSLRTVWQSTFFAYHAHPHSATLHHVTCSFFHLHGVLSHLLEIHVPHTPPSRSRQNLSPSPTPPTSAQATGSWSRYPHPTPQSLLKPLQEGALLNLRQNVGYSLHERSCTVAPSLVPMMAHSTRSVPIVARTLPRQNVGYGSTQHRTRVVPR